jgi:uncharacterized protein (TIGR02246 family)
LSDYESIRALVASWHRATAAEDIPKLLGLMAEDVVFLTPGRPPMRGRDAFADGLRALLQNARIESSAKIQELQVSGDLAYCWTQLLLNVFPRDAGTATRRSGPALTVLRKGADGKWLVFRDANLLAP